MIRCKSKSKINDVYTNIKIYDFFDVERAERENVIANWNDIQKDDNAYCEFWEHSYVCAYMFCYKLNDILKTLNNIRLKARHKVQYYSIYNSIKFIDFSFYSYNQHVVHLYNYTNNINKIRITMNKLACYYEPLRNTSHVKLFQIDTYPPHTTNCELSGTQCSNWQFITIEDTSTFIHPNIFNLTTLQQLHIPKSIEYIDDSIFRWILRLKKLTIPNTQDIFLESKFVEELELLPLSTTIHNWKYADFNSLKKIKIHSPISIIEECSFINCTNLIEISLPSTIKIISICAFKNCSSLEYVDLSNSMLEISYATFMNCINLKNIFLGHSIIKIGISSFENCKNINTINISNSVKEIGSSAFKDCVKLTKIFLPSSLAKIGFNVFHGCHDLTVYCEATSMPKEWNVTAFKDIFEIKWGFSRAEYDKLQ